MKYLFILFAACGTVYLVSIVLKKPLSNSTVRTVESKKQALCVAYYQDVSGSILQNGVEIISSDVFAPYFQSQDRNIELSFGIINDHSARKAIAITLYAIKFKKPQLPDLHNISLAEQRHVKELYAIAQSTYELDSAAYFSDRLYHITEFRRQVDSILRQYAKACSPSKKAKNSRSLSSNILSGETDLCTTVEIADRIFDASDSSTKKFLLFNSDGKDTNKRIARRTRNQAIVFLIGANAIGRTSLDSIISKKVQSSEAAIRLTLNYY